MSADEFVRAVANDDVAELERCLGQASSLSCKSGSRKALHHAASLGNADATRLLLEAKAEVNWADVLGLTALHKAAHSRKVKIIQLLLEARAQVNRIDKRHMTALHLAASSSNAAVMQLLLASMADANATTHLGETPLHKAAHAGHLELVQLLLEARAELDQTNVNGKMAVDVAEEACHHQVMEILASENQSESLLDGFFWHSFASVHGALHVACEPQSMKERHAQTSLLPLDALPSEVGPEASSVEPQNNMCTPPEGSYGSDEGLGREVLTMLSPRSEDPQNTCAADNSYSEQTSKNVLETLHPKVDTAVSNDSKQRCCGLDSVSDFVFDVTMRLFEPLREVDLPVVDLPIGAFHELRVSLRVLDAK
eukprot:TRINITY_DN32324_c0_g1_i1.p1 TRINITY_DN32324_c0_g1~~TRINITY_DN32324_c0_g1_i1.p1  ORF type:complete len:368 (-),score=76.77 TRINITY_DN32324_c0_g1_i1:335-1438(-)